MRAVPGSTAGPRCYPAPPRAASTARTPRRNASSFRAATDLFPAETFLATIRGALEKKPALAALNDEAFRRGVRAVEAARGGAG